MHCAVFREAWSCGWGWKVQLIAPSMLNPSPGLGIALIPGQMDRGVAKPMVFGDIAEPDEILTFAVWPGQDFAWMGGDARAQ